MSRCCVVLGKGQPFPADCALPGLICEALKYNELLTHHTSGLIGKFERVN